MNFFASFVIDEIREFWLACIENGRLYRSTTRVGTPDISLLDYRLTDALTFSRQMLTEMVARARANGGLANHGSVLWVLLSIIFLILILLCN